MSFTAKVIATGEFFHAAADLGPNRDRNRDAHLPIEPETFYSGNFFPGSSSGSSQYVEYSETRSAVFQGNELEYVLGDIRLVPVR